MIKKSILILLAILVVGINGNCQTQIGNDIDGEFIEDLSGHSVAVSANGSIVAIGAIENDDGGNRSGHVRVYENVDGTWTQLGEDIAGEATDDRSGWSLDISADGHVVAVGSDLNNLWRGQVEIYEYIGGMWTQIGEDIEGEQFQELSATSISLSNDGSIVAISSPRYDGAFENTGNVRVLENMDGAWIQVGEDIEGECEGERSGNSVSLNGQGNILAIGASQNDENGTNTGEVKIYKNVGGTWTQLGGDLNGISEFEDFGTKVALSEAGNIVAISSASSNANGTHSGHVRVFENIAGEWTQIGEDINGEAAEDYSGWSIGLSASGDVIAISAVWNDNSGFNAGNIRIFQNIDAVWTQVGLSINGESASDESGSSVDISADGNVVAIGAKFSDGNGDNSGHVRVFDLSSMILSIPTLDFEGTLSLYPNPVNNVLEIKLDANSVLRKVSIYDNSGQLILTAKKELVDVSKLASGLYTVTIESNNGNRSNKIIKL
jgi:Flp pilus assembly pilin Flp